MRGSLLSSHLSLHSESIFLRGHKKRRNGRSMSSFNTSKVSDTDSQFCFRVSETSKKADDFLFRFFSVFCDSCSSTSWLLSFLSSCCFLSSHLSLSFDASRNSSSLPVTSFSLVSLFLLSCTSLFLSSVLLLNFIQFLTLLSLV